MKELYGLFVKMENGQEQLVNGSEEDDDKI
jgi:hypothetical protein